MLQEHDNPLRLPLRHVELLDLANEIHRRFEFPKSKEAISTYNWSENARKDEVKFQLSPAKPAVARNTGAELGTGCFPIRRNPRGSFPTVKSSPVSRNQLRTAASSWFCYRLSLLPAGRCAT